MSCDLSGRKKLVKFARKWLYLVGKMLKDWVDSQ